MSFAAAPCSTLLNISSRMPRSNCARASRSGAVWQRWQAWNANRCCCCGRSTAVASQSQVPLGRASGVRPRRMPLSVTIRPQRSSSAWPIVRRYSSLTASAVPWPRSTQDGAAPCSESSWRPSRRFSGSSGVPLPISSPLSGRRSGRVAARWARKSWTGSGRQDTARGTWTDGSSEGGENARTSISGVQIGISSNRPECHTHRFTWPDCVRARTIACSTRIAHRVPAPDG